MGHRPLRQTDQRRTSRPALFAQSTPTVPYILDLSSRQMVTTNLGDVDRAGLVCEVLNRRLPCDCERKVAALDHRGTPPIAPRAATSTCAQPYGCVTQGLDRAFSDDRRLVVRPDIGLTKLSLSRRDLSGAVGSPASATRWEARRDCRTRQSRHRLRDSDSPHGRAIGDGSSGAATSCRRRQRIESSAGQDAFGAIVEPKLRTIGPRVEAANAASGSDATSCVV
jgi:hypothetical protein